MEILIATGNMHKVGEIQRILTGIPAKWRTTNDWKDATEPDENGATYEENAIIKGRTWSTRTGLWTIADDSGLEVEALGGRPGLKSARYARKEEDPIGKLLSELESVQGEQRAARFVCAAALVSADGQCYTECGYLNGTIAMERRGEGGFGFDPIFIPDGFEGAHLAELESDVKNRISHRARAFTALKNRIEELIQKKSL